ncbi:DUF3320 domain-containing protein [Cellulomonas sp. NTE-D12]|uniref:DUF3320 domain-containing protein n=1 Tax=Cellulomonas sp. NTE-D12 TaxID=2962632 RepID=UPI003081E4FB|nr:DNA helicase [Cellulomonas sp. NTE-D12]
MDEVDHHDQVGDAPTLLATGLAPFVARTLAEVLPAGVAWTELLRQKDAVAGRRGGVYSERDLSLALRAMTERLGDLGFPFSRVLSRQAQNYASELREIRNQWAHNQPFSAASAFRALDSAELLLREVGATDHADTISRSKADLLPTPTVAEPPSTTFATGDADAAERTDVVPTPSGAPGFGAPHITLGALPVLSYAMAHCQVAVIDEISVAHQGPDARGATLEVEVVCAGGSLGGPKVLMLDLADGQTTTLRNVDLLLDPARMLAVEEQQPGRILATLRNGAGTALATASSDVRVLAASQWMARPLQLGMEMLAAHVQPNSASIQPLLLEASDRLGPHTGDTSLNGYQSENPERVDAIAQSVYEAMAARDIRYAEPPASWGDEGQKVRTPQEVLDGRLGTCLDTTVTMAAALEQAGINSTLWLLNGHIVLGYWRVDSSLGSVASAEVSEIVNLVDLGHLALVETTMLTGGTSSAPFADACRSARGRIEHDVDHVLGVTDIRQARRTKIFPLPSRAAGADGQVVVSVYEPGAGPVIAPYQGKPAEQSGSGDPRRQAPPRVARWKNALLDLSLRNKLINYTDRAGFHLEVPGSALARLEDQISAHAPITLVPSDAVGSVDQARGIRFGRDLPDRDREVLLAEKRAAFIDVTAASYQNRLRYLAYKAKTIVQETGSNNLYLAFGMLRWRFADRDLRSPLVLVPVTLTTTSRGETYRVTLDESGASTPNYCLLEKLRVSFGLEVPGLEEPTEDASGIDLPAALGALRVAVAQAGLPFRVEETVELAILQFAKFPLWKDLDEHWSTLSANSLVKHLIETPLEPFADPVEPIPADLDELGALVPVPADSSQLEAVHDAVAGRTFVLEGPPGTGKSQTITNVLARALASGKRVLFVAEKRAALDVVKKRLAQVGLAELSLDLHDKGARPADVRAQIRAALDLHVQADDDAMRSSAETLDASRRRLALYAERLHETNGIGHSLYSARAFDLASDQTIQPIEVPRAFVATGTAEHVEALRQALRRVPEVADLARPRPRHPWRFIDAGAGPVDVAATLAAARMLDDALGRIEASGLGVAALGYLASPDDADVWGRLADAPRHPIEALDALRTRQGLTYLDALSQELSALATDSSEWRRVVSPEVMNRDVTALHQAAVAAEASGFFGRKKRCRAVLSQFADLLLVPTESLKRTPLSKLTSDMAQTYDHVTRARTALSQLPIPLAQPGWNPAFTDQAAGARDELAWVRWTLDAFAPDGTPVRDQLRGYYTSSPRGQHRQELTGLAAAWQVLDRTGAVDRELARAWAGAAGFLPTWWATRSERSTATAVSLERWVNLIGTLEPLRTYGLLSGRRALLDGVLAPDDAVIALDRGLALASIEERREATALGDFDISAHNRTVERFTASSRAVRAELPRAIPQDILAARRFSTSSQNGQMGGLRRQLDRQRGGMSVRTLMASYGELITQILPCTLTSPESVARFFPPRADLFDVVVFDEASQIRVADAVGAMGRGRSVVVVGDSKQMPPTQFAEASASSSDDEEYLPEEVLDEESILSECVQARVPSRWLSWHYRSQDESLIAFSNRHYYENRLSSFPAPLPRDSRKHPDGYGISLVRVAGTFERSGRGRALRTNRVEAEAIVRDVQQRFWASADVAPSLGVITFNAQQRDLIDNLLRDSGDDRIVLALDEPDGLFVKNLENVQGDERDCILFSVAFSANDKGVVPLNFGPLSKPGGERRLNVAVTRARRQVVLYASFDPAQLRAEETTQVGTKHLKAYLELAAHGVDAIQDTGGRLALVDRHRDDIADSLRAAGFTVSTDVGLSDFRVDISVADASAPEQPLLAILLDGPGWRARRTVADRDGLPVDVLKAMMRWPGVARVWQPEWLRDREGTLERLAQALVDAREARRAAPSITVGEATAAAQPVAATEPVAPRAAEVSTPSRSVEDLVPVRSLATTSARPSSNRHPHLAEYAEWIPPRMGARSVLDELPYPHAARRVARAATAAIEAEGPIHPDRLAKLVASAFDLSRVNDDRRQAILRTVPQEHRPTHGEGFYWPAGVDPMTWRVVRVPTPGESRALEEISLHEISNAMRVAAEEAGGMTGEEVKLAALNLFGGRRRTDAIRDRLSQALTHATQRGVVTIGPDGIYRPGQV